MSIKVIEVLDLTKKFGNFTAVDHIAFDVKEGEIFGFMGANGAGKTTAMQMLCGISMPTAAVSSIVPVLFITSHSRFDEPIASMYIRHNGIADRVAASIRRRRAQNVTIFTHSNGDPSHRQKEPAEAAIGTYCC